MCAAGRILAEPRITADGNWVVFVAMDARGTRLIKVAASGGAEIVLTSEPSPARCHPSGGGVIAMHPSGRWLVYVGGDSALWRIDLEGGPAHLVVPATDGMWSPVFSLDGSRIAYSVDQASLWVVEPGSTSAPVRLPTTSAFVMDPVWLDDDTVVWQAWDPPDMAWDRSRLERSSVDGNHGVVISAPELQCQQPVVDRRGALAFIADGSGWLNVHRLVDGDPAVVVNEPFEHAGATWGDRQRTVAWSPDGRKLAFARNEGGFGRLCVIELESSHEPPSSEPPSSEPPSSESLSNDSRSRPLEVGKGTHTSLDWAGHRLVALRSGACTPTQLVSYDDQTWERTVLARGPVGGFEAALVEPTLETFTAADDATVHARLYQPTTGSSGRLICWLHGGPTDQWPVEFNPRMAYFLSRGWSVVVPDHRGSTGHGRAYTQALRGRWGDLDVTDIAAVIAGCRARGWAEHVVAMGASAGGFTVLNLLASQPGLVAAAVTAFPVTDLVALLNTTHRYEAHYFESLVGGWPECENRYWQRSVHPAALRDPLLVLHGTSDNVVPIEHSRRLVAELTALGGSVEMIEYVDEGHGWRKSATLIDELNRIEAFLDAHTTKGPR
jgi:dipeptidyl aminopeptidase/acylaminoacyl peptidase